MASGSRGWWSVAGSWRVSGAGALPRTPRLTRSRRQLVEDRARDANRVQKVLETATIKLAAVATDGLGASGRAMLKALIAGERDAGSLAALARGLWRKKPAQLREALVGRVTDHHAVMLQGLLSHIEFLDQSIARFEARIEAQTRPFTAAVERLDTTPASPAEVPSRSSPNSATT
jgi:hypothetical protein